LVSIFGLAFYKLTDGKPAKGGARGERDLNLARLLSQPRLQYPSVRNLDQRLLPPSSSLHRVQHGR
jgi:hypothetical protein